MSGGVERGSDAGEAVGHDRIRLPLAVRAHQQHPRSVPGTQSCRVHQSPREPFAPFKREVKLPGRPRPSRPR